MGCRCVGALALLWQARTGLFATMPSAWGLSSNGALSAQALLLLFPAFLTAGRRRRWLRALLGLVVVAFMWRAASSVGLALGLVWIACDVVLTRGVVRRAPRPALTAVPVGHALLTAAVVASGIMLPALESVLDGRARMWRLALDVFKTSPLIGVGPDTVSHAATKVVTAVTAQTLLDNPLLTLSSHSIWLDLAANYGALGVLCAMAATLLLVRRWSTEVKSAGFVFAAGLTLYSLTLLVQPLALQTVPLLVLVIAASVVPSARVAATANSERASLAVGALAAVVALVPLLYGGTCLAVGRPDFYPGPRPFTESAARFWRLDPELWAQTAYRYGMEIGSSQNPQQTIGEMERAFERAIDLVPREYSYRLDT